MAECLPHFSTDPDASKQLRDKMRAYGWQFCMGDNGDVIEAGFARGRKESGEGDADTEELAVALKAKGVEGPGE